MELRSWLHRGNWGQRQRTPYLAHDRCCPTEDVLCHVALAFLRAASGSDSPCFRGSLVQALDRSRRQTGGEGSTATGAQVLAEFVLIYDPVVRLIGASDRLSRLVARIIEPDNLIATTPSHRLTILRVRDGLSHSKTVTPCGAHCRALFWLLRSHEGAGRTSLPASLGGTRLGEEVTGCAIADGTVQSSNVRPPSSITRRASVRGGQRLVPVGLRANAKAAAPSAAAIGRVPMTSRTPRRYLLNWTRNFMAATFMLSFSDDSSRLGANHPELLVR
jgi:hypothetical protein